MENYRRHRGSSTRAQRPASSPLKTVDTKMHYQIKTLRKQNQRGERHILYRGTIRFNQEHRPGPDSYLLWTGRRENDTGRGAGHTGGRRGTPGQLHPVHEVRQLFGNINICKYPQYPLPVSGKTPFHPLQGSGTRALPACRRGAPICTGGYRGWDPGAHLR